MYSFFRSHLGERQARIAAIVWYSLLLIVMYVLSVERDSPFVYLTF